MLAKIMWLLLSMVDSSLIATQSRVDSSFICVYGNSFLIFMHALGGNVEGGYTTLVPFAVPILFVVLAQYGSVIKATSVFNLVMFTSSSSFGFFALCKFVCITCSSSFFTFDLLGIVGVLATFDTLFVLAYPSPRPVARVPTPLNPLSGDPVRATVACPPVTLWPEQPLVGSLEIFAPLCQVPGPFARFWFIIV